MTDSQTQQSSKLRAKETDAHHLWDREGSDQAGGPLRGAARHPAALVGFTRREREIVCLIASGFRNREIAQRLQINEQTVKNHICRAFAKTGVEDRLQLAFYFISNGL